MSVTPDSAYPAPSPHPGARRSRRVASAVLAVAIAGAGAVVVATPASADVVNVRQDATSFSWDCANPLPANPMWVLHSSQYSLGPLNGSIPAGSGFTVGLTGLSTGTYTASLQCTYEPVWSPGNGGTWTYGSATVSYVAPVTAPSAPRNLVATPGDGRVELTWDAPDDDGGEAVEYDVVTDLGGVVATVTGRAHTLTGLTNGVPVQVSVLARNGAGSSPAAGPATVTPQAPVADVTLTVSPGGARVAEDVLVTAHVSAGGVDVPDGHVRFSSLGETVDVPVVAGSASASFTLPRQTGEVQFVADFLGSDHARPASASTPFWVGAQTPTLAVVAPATVTAGVPFTVEAAISGPVDVPEGDVQLIAYQPGGGSGPVVVNRTLRDGQVSAELPGLPLGQWRVLAHYSGSSTQGQYAQVDSPELSLDVVAAPVPVDLTVPTDVTTPVGTPATLTLDVPAGPRPATVTVLDGDDVLVVAPVPASGPVVVTLPVLRPGSRVLTVTTPASAELLASSTDVELVVAGEPARVGSVPTGDLGGARTAAAGSELDLRSGGFTPGETVAFFLHPAATLLGTAEADPAGFARLRTVVPPGTSSGEHTVVATGGLSGAWAELGLTVPAAGAETLVPIGPAAPAQTTAPTVTTGPVAASAPAAASALAATGSDGAPLLAVVALLLVTLGGALVRRRPRGTC